MFSGIVEECGTVDRRRDRANLSVLTIRTHRVYRGTSVGDSVSVNGVCLTVTAREGACLSFDVMKETLDVTTLGGARRGDPVNLERALRVNGRLGGHVVTGHVDGTAVLERISRDADYVAFRVRAPRRLRRYLVEKGSVCLDGVSLTVGPVVGERFTVYLIPHTLKITSLGRRRPGDRMNIETDILAKYVLRDLELARGTRRR